MHKKQLKVKKLFNEQNKPFYKSENFNPYLIQLFNNFTGVKENFF